MQNSFHEDLIRFIEKNEDWKDLLSKSPYNLTIKNHPTYENLYLFSYNQIASDFHNPIVKVSRGSVFEITDNVRPICLPFFKFGNIGESYCDEIDPNSFQGFEKIDGSLIKLFYYMGKWHWMTNNGFDTTQKTCSIVCRYNEPETEKMDTFQQLIDYSLSKHIGWEENLAIGWTYMFELISPRNRIICQYPKTDLILLGSRDYNQQEHSAEETKELFNFPFSIPKKIDARNVKEVLAYCDEIKDDSEEGIVVVDKDFHRVKIKCAFYKHLKFIKGETYFSEKAIFESCLNGEIDDAVVAFPEIKAKADEIKAILQKQWNKLFDIAKLGKEKYKELENRKAYAEWVKKEYPKQSTYLFEVLKEKYDLVSIFRRMKYEDFQLLDR
jgi:hypothetical protein